MNRSALFADINKLRDSKNVIGDKQVKQAAKSKPPPPATTNSPNPVTSINTQPLSAPSSPDPPDPARRRKKSKKKKKRKSKANLSVVSAPYTPPDELSDDAAPEFSNRSRQKTAISVLADRGYPSASSLLSLSHKPPRLLFVYVLAFLASMDMMMNIPTLYAAISSSPHSDYYYVYIFVVYVSAQFASTLVLGAWLDRRPIVEILAFLSLFLLAGNVTYTFGVHNGSGIEKLLGRALCGVGSCILVIGYAHVTRYSKSASREARILYLRFVIAVGTIIGPLIGTVVGGGSASWTFLAINENNSGSFVMSCVVSAYLIALCVFLLLEKRREGKRKEEVKSLWGRKVSDSLDMDDQYSDANRELSEFVWRPHRFCSVEAVMLWFLYTSAVFTFWSFTGAIVPVGASTEMDTTQIYAVFVYVGITYLAAFGLNKFVSRCLKIDLEQRVIVSLILMIVGSVFLTSFGVSSDDDESNIASWQFVIATPFLTCGFCISTITIPALYVTLVGAGVGGLGLRMSWFFSLASFGVLAGPIYGFLVWKQTGSVNFISHTASLLLLLALMVGFIMVSRMRTHRREREQSKRAQNEFDDMGVNVGVGVTSSGNELNQGLLSDRL